MHEQVEALRSRIDGVPKATDGRRVFTAAIRKDVVEVAKKWQAHGRTRKALADALGLHEATVLNWLGKTARSKKAVARVRPVRVEEQPPRQSVDDAGIGRIAIVLPTGIRIENLSIREAAALAREL